MVDTATRTSVLLALTLAWPRYDVVDRIRRRNEGDANSAARAAQMRQTLAELAQSGVFVPLKCFSPWCNMPLLHERGHSMPPPPPSHFSPRGRVPQVAVQGQ